jgi:hypothetical protein
MKGARRIGRRMALTLLVVSSGCVSRPSMFGGGAANDFARTLNAAQDDAARGRYDEADRVLAHFAEQHPGTSQAAETLYWRAIFRVDPANRDASVPVAIAALDSYLATGSSLIHRGEAATLRRVAAQLEAASKLASANVTTPTNVARAVTAADTKARDEEIQHLKDELAKANDELERIKRRLATPKP